MENKLIFAKEIIKEAGAFIKESLSKTITVEEKTAFDDLVTNIDKQTQDLLVARIKSAFPSDNIFAELGLFLSENRCIFLEVELLRLMP